MIDTITESSPGNDHWITGVCLAVLAAVGCAIAQLQETMTFRGAVLRRYFPEYLAGDAGEIFNARFLLRWILRGLWEVLGGDIYRINLWLQSIFMVFGLWAVWFFARTWLSHAGALLAAILAGAWTTWGFAPFTGAISYPYDLPAFAFSAIGLVAVVRRWPYPLALVLLIGGCNKETVFWLVPAWLAVGWSLAEHRLGRSLWVRFAVLAGCFAASYLGPRFFLPSGAERAALTMSWVETDPGAPMPGSLRVVQNARLLFLGEPDRGFPYIHLAISLHLVAWIGWRRLPPAMRGAMLASPAFLVPTLLVGNVWELRIFNELLPLTATALVIGAAGVRPKPDLARQSGHFN